MYKDADTTVYRSKIQRFVKWCDEHHLIHNIKKTEEMVFHHKTTCLWFTDTLYNANIAQVSWYTSMDVHMDNVLSWKVQVESACFRVQQCLYFLLGVAPVLSCGHREYPEIWHHSLVWQFISSTEIPNCPPDTNCHEGHGCEATSLPAD
jgi:hypothetical protein